MMLKPKSPRVAGRQPTIRARARPSRRLPAWRTEAPGRFRPLRQLAEEVQSLHRGDQARRGGRESGPLPQGGEAASGGLSVSRQLPYRMLFIILFLFEHSS